ncbi:MAG TPA: GNAT family N-acetyltransferase [Vicinamibacterales bacterium]|nr:GNAT family N-acetyltransferase [Vicinamibacterales bacterium]
MTAPDRVETRRLIMSVPQPNEAAEVFERYASDPGVTRYLGWPTHQVIADTEGFIAFSTSQWEREGMGPYLIRSRENGVLLGSTGLGLANTGQPENTFRAMTGYVLARDAWGQGYATEALRAMINVARGIGIVSLSALCHPEHQASAHVLEKCEFARDLRWTRQTVFPNLQPGPQDVRCFTRSC